jgi:hypothetical protein
MYAYGIMVVFAVRNGISQGSVLKAKKMCSYRNSVFNRRFTVIFNDDVQNIMKPLRGNC